MQSVAFKSAVIPAVCRSPAVSRAQRRNAPWSPRADIRSQASDAQTIVASLAEPMWMQAATQLLLTTSLLSMPAGLAFAEEVVPDVTAAGAEAVDAAAAAVTEGGLPVAELALVLSPIILYGIFNVYRSALNPRAKLSDFLFIVAAIAIVGNILSILIFKKRFF